MRTRFSRLEDRIKKSVFQQSVRDTVRPALPGFYADWHYTAVVAVWRYGNPQIDEPLCRAYRRAMNELESSCGANIDQLLEEHNSNREQLRALALSPIVLLPGPRGEADLFALPAWLLKFTGVKRDADILGYALPPLSHAPELGREARKDRDRWPLLPKRTIDAGGHCDKPDWHVRTEELLRRNTPWKF